MGIAAHRRPERFYPKDNNYNTRFQASPHSEGLPFGTEAIEIYQVKETER